MSRNYEQRPEMFPVSRSDYDPDADGWKADARAKLKVVEDAVDDDCHEEIERDETCPCVQAHGYREEMLANPSCPACGGTGRLTQKTLVAGIDALHSLIDQFASTAGDICTPAKTFRDLAWWHTENAIRQVTGKCSMACKRRGFCGCCQHYHELKPLAGRMGRSLMHKVYQ